MQKQPLGKFCETVLNNFAIFTGKNLCLETPFNSEYCKKIEITYLEEHLQMVASESAHDTEKS